MSLPPSEIPLGAMRFNSDSQKLEYWMGSAWMQIQTFSPTLDGGARGIFFSGSPANTNGIEFITIATTGNASDFGDLTAQSSGRGSSTSNSIRGVYFHGTGSYVNTIGFVIIQTTGDEVDFGDNTYKSHGQGSGSTAHGGLS